MAQPASPFQCGGSVVAITLGWGKKIDIRVEGGGTFQVNIKVNGTVDSTHADFMLNATEGCTIHNKDHDSLGDKVLNILNIGAGDPHIFYSISGH